MFKERAMRFMMMVKAGQEYEGTHTNSELLGP